MRQKKIKLELFTFGVTIVTKKSGKQSIKTLCGVLPSPSFETPEDAIKALLHFINRELGTHYALSIQTDEQIIKEMTG